MGIGTLGSRVLISEKQEDGEQKQNFLDKIMHLRIDIQKFCDRSLRTKAVLREIGAIGEQDRRS